MFIRLGDGRLHIDIDVLPNHHELSKTVQRGNKKNMYVLTSVSREWSSALFGWRQMSVSEQLVVVEFPVMTQENTTHNRSYINVRH